MWQMGSGPRPEFHRPRDHGSRTRLAGQALELPAAGDGLRPRACWPRPTCTAHAGPWCSLQRRQSARPHRGQPAASLARHRRSRYSLRPVRQALTELGLSDDDLLRHGIRILRVGMPYPSTPTGSGAGPRHRRPCWWSRTRPPFVETQVVQALYGGDQRPTCSGSTIGSRPLIPADGELTAARLLTPLYRVLRSRVPVQSPPPPRPELTPLSTPRTPFFCSGCSAQPLDRGARGLAAAGGIGCHTLVTMSPRTESAVTGVCCSGNKRCYV